MKRGDSDEDVSGGQQSSSNTELEAVRNEASAADSGGEASTDKRNLHFKELMEVKERESFPEQLMKILDEEKAPSAMWWMPDGKAFAIKLDKVAEDVLDRFFQASKYATFTRRLNKWGFRKAPGKPVHLPPKTVVYFHSLFQRDEKELIKHMSDKKSKGKSAQAAGGSPAEGAGGISGSIYPSFAQHQQQQAASLLQQQQQHYGQTNLSPDFLLQQMLGPNAAATGGSASLFQGAAGGGSGAQGAHNNFGLLGNSSIYQLLGNNNAGGSGQQGLQANALGPIAQFLQQQNPQQHHNHPQQHQQHQQQTQPLPQQNPHNTNANTGYHQHQSSLEEFLRYQQQLNQGQNDQQNRNNSNS